MIPVFLFLQILSGFHKTEIVCLGLMVFQVNRHLRLSIYFANSSAATSLTFFSLISSTSVNSSVQIYEDGWLVSW
jgi:hypothetical protein